ncbi:CRISPR-associated endoribonuclease Cas2 [compost metagenome]
MASDRRRSKLTRVLSAHGVRVQQSVFECLVRPGDEAALRAALADTLDAGEDRLKLYPLCAGCRLRVESLGMPLGTLDDGSGWIV